MAGVAGETGVGDGAELPATAFAVLGFLTVNEEELTAGEIHTRAGYVLRHFYWAPAVSHIRRELRRLHELGLVAERTVTVGPVRRSQVWRSTTAGGDALAAWMAEEGALEPVMTKNPALLRVYFGAHVDPSRTITVVDARLRQVESDIEEATWGRRRAAELGLASEHRLRYQNAVADYTLRGMHLELANLRQLRDTLVGFDAEAFRRDTTRRRGAVRRRRGGEEPAAEG